METRAKTHIDHGVVRIGNRWIERQFAAFDGATVVLTDKATGFENVYLGVGMCGQGFMMGPGIARNLTNIILKGEPLIEKEVAASLRADRDFYAAKKEALK